MKVDECDIDVLCFFFLIIRRPPRSTQCRSSAASDVYKGQAAESRSHGGKAAEAGGGMGLTMTGPQPVSYTHLRAHETVLDPVCRLLLEKKKKKKNKKQ